MKYLKKSKRPVVLTVKGKAAAIVQDAESYQRLLDIAARAEQPHVYRVIYHVMERQKEVDILHVRHDARQEFKTGDLG